jgi:glycine betaine/proline transport system substrate-binding protein
MRRDRANSLLAERTFVEDLGELMKAAFSALFVLLVVGTLVTAGCGGGASGKTLEIADIGWTENTAIAALTKVLLEQELAYEEVTIKTSDLDSVYEGVADGDLDAFQDVWLPNQQNLLQSVEDDVEQLSFSYEGQTEQGIAVPSYMKTTSLNQLNDSEADLILGIEPGSVVMGKIYEEVIPAYGLHQRLVEGPRKVCSPRSKTATATVRSLPWWRGRLIG